MNEGYEFSLKRSNGPNVLFRQIEDTISPPEIFNLSGLGKLLDRVRAFLQLSKCDDQHSREVGREEM